MAASTLLMATMHMRRDLRARYLCVETELLPSLLQLVSVHLRAAPLERAHAPHTFLFCQSLLFLPFLAMCAISSEAMAPGDFIPQMCGACLNQNLEGRCWQMKRWSKSKTEEAERRSRRQREREGERAATQPQRHLQKKKENH